MAEKMQFSQEAQRAMIQMQTLQQQIQVIAMQKETIQIQEIELSKALEELKKSKDSDDVFRAIGPILIKRSKKDLEKELSESKGSLELKMKSLNDQELRIRDKMKEAQNKVQEILKSAEQKEKSAG